MSISESKTLMAKLGFELVRQYAHDEFYTYVYDRNIVTVEFTFCNNRLRTRELIIKNDECIPVTTDDIKILKQL